MFQFDPATHTLRGDQGTLVLDPDDEVAHKLLMLIEGQCLGLGPTASARKYGFSKQRYFQLLHAFQARGTSALHSARRGPKKPSRRTPEVVRQIVRHRFLDPDVSTEVIAQKLAQCAMAISARTVRRVIEHYGLQKKTLRGPAQPTRPSHRGGNPAHQGTPAKRTVRPSKSRTRRSPGSRR